MNAVVGLIALICAAIGMPVFIVTAVRVLPNTSLGSRLALRRSRLAPGDATPQAEQLADLVGREAKTVTVLRPSGTLMIDGRRIDATAETGMIEKGQPVRIIRTTGTNVVVREVSS